MPDSKNVVHLTSVHPRYDTRIFLKMCTSLAMRGYRTTLVVADGLGDEEKCGVSVLDVGETRGGRIERITRTVHRVFRQALQLNADIYHLHDPELIRIGLRLKRRGKRVIFDSHEDVPRQILSKPYLNPVIRRPLSFVLAAYERVVARHFDAIVTATPGIASKFSKINPNTIGIYNYPLLDELNKPTLWADKRNEVAYVGAISELRGIRQLIEAIGATDGVTLNLAGKFSEAEVEAEVANLQGWARINFVGYADRGQVGDIMSRSKAGLVTFLPAPNHVDSQPNKLFEYMSAGLPVVASNFPLWRETVEANDCGICVDPLQPDDIASAIQKLVDNGHEAERLGTNGRRAVEQKYNWESESEKLFDLYERL